MHNAQDYDLVLGLAMNQSSN